MKILEIVHPKFSDLIKELGTARLKGEAVLPQYEFQIVKKDGVVRWIEFTSTKIDFDGESAALGTAFDITDRKIAEKLLMEEKQLFDTTLRSIREGVVTIDFTGRIVLINPIALKILHMGTDDTIGMNYKRVLNFIDTNGKKIKFDLKDFPEEADDPVTDQRAYFQLDRETQISISYGIAPIIDPTGDIAGWVFAIRDITDILYLEDELLKSQKLDSIGILAGGIAHDFNNILTAILGNISLAKMYAGEGSKVYNQVDIAEKAAFRARDLTQQLLTFSKGGMPVKQTTDLKELILESAKFTSRGAKSKCEFHFDEDLSFAFVDPGQISQVFQNLILNAYQAMPEGGNIDIRAGNHKIDNKSNLHLKPGKYVKIVIADQGTGIDPELQQKIFDPFFTTKDYGSGLGLSSAYSIINKHNGFIVLDSSNKKGSTFIIYLPASDGEVDLKDPDKDLDFKGEGKILIMDDQIEVGNTLSKMLNHFGFSTELVSDGEKVLNKVKSTKGKGAYFAIILDLTIPGGMGGREAAEKILKISPETKLIVASGYSNDPILANHKEYGFKGRLHKPFDVHELIEVIRGISNTKD